MHTLDTVQENVLILRPRLKYCPINAIHLSDKTAVIDTSKCIECGQCGFHCPKAAIELVIGEREVYVPIQKKSE